MSQSNSDITLILHPQPRCLICTVTQSFQHAMERSSFHACTWNSALTEPSPLIGLLNEKKPTAGGPIGRQWPWRLACKRAPGPPIQQHGRITFIVAVLDLPTSTSSPPPGWDPEPGTHSLFQCHSKPVRQNMQMTKQTKKKKLQQTLRPPRKFFFFLFMSDNLPSNFQSRSPRSKTRAKSALTSAAI